MSILVYDGLRELIKREFIDRNMATTDATVDSATNLIRTVMEDYRGKALQLVGTTLPSTGVPGTIYLQSKSEPNEKNRFIAYAYEDGKFVQVGSSFFPEDFAPDSELNINSQVTVENRVLKSAIDDKFNLSGVINNVIPTEPNSVHAKDTPTSAAIQAELATKLGYEDGSRITPEQLWQVFRPELTRLVYPQVNIRTSKGAYGTYGSNYVDIYRLAGKHLLSNLVYKPGQGAISTGGYHTFDRIFVDTSSDREVKVRIISAYTDGIAGFNENLFNGDVYPAEFRVYFYCSPANWDLTFRFLDPVPLGLLTKLVINLRCSTVTDLKITTRISDTGEDNTYTTVQDSVRYDRLYTDGIPFYGFN